MCLCSECSAEHTQHFMDQVLQLLGEHAWLVDSFILDFFVAQHWTSLPRSWRDVLLTLDPQELGHWLDISKTYRYKKVWPLSLLALKSAAKNLSIPRKPEHVSSSEVTQHCKHCKFIDLELRQDDLQDTKLFSKNIKPKKYHEINRMAKVASSCAQELGCQYIVDVGSGLGHLGRLLALRHGLRVCCLEEQVSLTSKARKLDENLIKILMRKRDKVLIPPVHINVSIEAAVQCDEFLKQVHTAFGNDPAIRFGIVGLHPCGDLGPTLLRLFVNCPGACFINLVGCCYMKLTDESSLTVAGYPLSNYTLSREQHFLSYEAREVACHAIENYCQRLRDGCVSDLKVHCYRAVLENVIVKLQPDLKHSGLRSIKHVQDMEFTKYVDLAVDRLGLQIPHTLLDTPETQEQLSQWLQVVVFYSLRLLLAPSVESAILVDRMLFLHEAGIRSILFPAFDPELSPRNHILIAMKH